MVGTANFVLDISYLIKWCLFYIHGRQLFAHMTTSDADDDKISVFKYLSTVSWFYCLVVNITS